MNIVKNERSYASQELINTVRVGIAAELGNYLKYLNSKVDSFTMEFSTGGLACVPANEWEPKALGFEGEITVSKNVVRAFHALADTCGSWDFGFVANNHMYGIHLEFEGGTEFTYNTYTDEDATYEDEGDLEEFGSVVDTSLVTDFSTVGDLPFALLTVEVSRDSANATYSVTVVDV